MDLHTLVLTIMVKSKELDSTNGVMVLSTLVNGMTTKSMVQVYIHGLMGGPTRDNGYLTT